MVSRNFSRRDFLKMTAGGVVVASAMPSLSWASLPDEPRVLAMNNLNTGELWSHATSTVVLMWTKNLNGLISFVVTIVATKSIQWTAAYLIKSVRSSTDRYRCRGNCDFRVPFASNECIATQQLFWRGKEKHAHGRQSDRFSLRWRQAFDRA